MTKKFSDSNNTLNQPFMLRPVGKDYLWGGTRLNDDFSKNIDLHPLAETWECSTHPDGPSIVASGEFRGCELSRVIRENPRFLGQNCADADELPILLKLIDADKDLSVQVHPDDDYAREFENGQQGKTEMWYVLDALKDTKIIYGLTRSLTKEEFISAAKSDTIEKYLQKVPAKKNDLFFVNAGTVHAIGKGALIAEIQENSNLTYRIYDYHRTDKNGNLRPLHLDKAAAVADLSQAHTPVQPMRVLDYVPGCAKELLCRCRYFQVERWLINTERQRDLVKFSTGSLSFSVLLCVDGCGSFTFGDSHVNFFRGDCLFIPADSVEVSIHASAQLLHISC